MNKHIERNREHIQANKERIQENKDCIKENRDAIQDLNRRIHWLVIALVVMVVLLFFTNALWLYASHRETTIIAKDGTANYIGGDGEITNG